MDWYGDGSLHVLDKLGFRFEGERVAQIAGELGAPAFVAGRVEVRVADNGQGFDDAYAQRIFRPFERLHGRGQFPGTIASSEIASTRTGTARTRSTTRVSTASAQRPPSPAAVPTISPSSTSRTVAATATPSESWAP